MTQSPSPDPLLGRIVAGRYQVLRLIGRGAMGAIYEVRHRKLKRSFAMKVMSEQLANNRVAMARFQREAEIVARLRHPNIVEVIDIETLPNGCPCMVMEYLEGEDLSQRLRRGPLSWAEIARVADEVMTALEVAHRHGIVHRDLKPQNVFLVRDEAGGERCKLLDFGVSKIRSADVQTHTEADGLVGTPAYMSPEQAEGRTTEVESSTDVWAMGAILYELATGKRAFEAANTPALLYRICYGAPDPIAPLRPDAPAAFIDAVNAALSRDAAIRISNVATLRELVRASLPEHPVQRASWMSPDSDPTTATPSLALAFSAEITETTMSSSTGELEHSLNVPSLRPGRAGSARTTVAAIAVAGACAVALMFAPDWIASRHAPSPLTPSQPIAAAQPREIVTKAPPVSPTRSTLVRRIPADAKILVDGVEVTGERVTWSNDQSAHVLVVTAPGHVDDRRALDASTAPELEIRLERTRIARRASAARAPLARLDEGRTHSAKSEPAIEKPVAAAPRRSGNFLSPFAASSNE